MMVIDFFHMRKGILAMKISSHGTFCVWVLFRLWSYNTQHDVSLQYVYHSTDYTLPALLSWHLRDFFIALLLLSAFSFCFILTLISTGIKSIFSFILSSISLLSEAVQNIASTSRFSKIYSQSSRVVRHPPEITTYTTDNFCLSFLTLTWTLWRWNTDYKKTMAKFLLT